MAPRVFYICSGLHSLFLFRIFLIGFHWLNLFFDYHNGRGVGSASSSTLRVSHLRWPNLLLLCHEALRDSLGYGGGVRKVCQSTLLLVVHRRCIIAKHLLLLFRSHSSLIGFCLSLSRSGRQLRDGQRAYLRSQICLYSLIYDFFFIVRCGSALRYDIDLWFWYGLSQLGFSAFARLFDWHPLLALRLSAIRCWLWFTLRGLILDHDYAYT